MLEAKQHIIFMKVCGVNDHESQQSELFTWHLRQIFDQLLRDIMNKFYLMLRK